MKPLSATVVEAGLVPPNALAEMQRFRPSLAQVEAPTEAAPLDEVASQLRRVRDSDDLTVRETDLDAVQTYLQTQQEGVLHLTLDGLDGPVSTDFPVTYGRTRIGDIIIAWTNDSIKEAMLTPQTYLTLSDGSRACFTDVRELYYDETKAFMVCRMSVTP